MKRKRYSVEQIVAAVKQHELGTPAAEIARDLGIAEQTFYRWKKEYGGLEPGQARELRRLREEDATLKEIVADLSLYKAMLTDIAKERGEGTATSRSSVLLARSLRGQRTAGVSRRRPAEVGGVVPVPAPAPGRAEAPHQGARRGPYSVRLQAYPRVTASGQLADQPQACSLPLLRAGPTVTRSSTSWPCQCCASIAAQASCASPQRGLEHGLHV